MKPAAPRAWIAIPAAIAVILLAAPGCGKRPAEQKPDGADVQWLVDVCGVRGKAGGGITVTYPETGTVFPPGLPAPRFEWKTAGANVDSWAVLVRVPGPHEPLVIAADGGSWQPDESTWAWIKERTRDAAGSIVVAAGSRSDPETVLSSQPVEFRTAREPVGAPIFYRDVPLPFIYAVKNPDTIRWRLGDVTAAEPAPVALEGLPVCGNCHSFDAAGTVLGMDIDYANDKGSYAITELEARTPLSREKVITWSDYRREDEVPTFGLLSQVSPDGRYVVSTVKDRSVFVPRPDLAYSQLFFPIQGILAVYDRETKTFRELPGAADAAYVQSNPSWSPDGKWVYFCRAEAARIPEDESQKDVLITSHLAREFVEKGRDFKFDIYRVPFNEGRGGTPRPVPGASANGKSNFFPRLSPDGKWLVFCRAENFMLLQPDSRLFIMPAAGGEPREMACNLASMNSWHSWSPNSRWLVFAGKARGPYTQLYLAHVDAQGQDAPAVLLEHLSVRGRACNIPEFVNRTPGERFVLREHFLDSENFRRQAQVLLLSGDAAESVPLFKESLKRDPNNHDARLRLAAAYSQLGNDPECVAELDRLIAMLGPAEGDADRRYEAHCRLAMQHRRYQRTDQAAEQYRQALQARPDDLEVRLFLALLHASQSRFEDAERYLREILDRAPGHGLAHLWLGQVLGDTDREEPARTHLARALQSTPRAKDEWLLIGGRLLGDATLRNETRTFIQRYQAVYPDCAQGHVLMAKALLETGETAAATSELEKARKLDPSIPWLDEKIKELKVSGD